MAPEHFPASHKLHGAVQLLILCSDTSPGETIIAVALKQTTQILKGEKTVTSSGPKAKRVQYDSFDIDCLYIEQRLTAF